MYRARVLSVQGRQACVELLPMDSCTTCKRGGGCGAGLFGELPVAVKHLVSGHLSTNTLSPASPAKSGTSATRSPRQRLITVQNPLRAVPGDSVEVNLPDDLLPKLALAGYFLPVVLIVFATLVGHMLSPVAGIAPDTGALAGLFVGLFAGFSISGSGGVLAYRRGYIGGVIANAEIRPVSLRRTPV